MISVLICFDQAISYVGMPTEANMVTRLPDSFIWIVSTKVHEKVVKSDWIEEKMIIKQTETWACSVTILGRASVSSEDRRILVLIFDRFQQIADIFLIFTQPHN